MSELGPIGWIGLGAMGLPMARRVRGAGFDIRWWSRRPAAPELAAELGRTAAATSPRDLAETCPIVCTIVGGPADVEAIMLAPDGLLAGAPRGSILIDHTTSSPALARRIASIATVAGVQTLDAPVSGGSAGAAAGRLSMMVGGASDALDRVRPLLTTTATTILHHGGPGSGQSAKLANQVLVAGTMLAIADARRTGLGAGLDDDRLRSTLGSGIAGSPLLDVAWRKASQGDTSPGFAVDHLIKDLELALESDPRLEAGLVGLALSRYRALAAAGHGRDGTQTLLLSGWSDGGA